MVHCAVGKCRRRWENLEKFVSFHNFPKDPKIAKKWLDACKRKDLNRLSQIRPWHVLCSMHFDVKCFNYHLSYENVKLSLKAGSLPKLNLPKYGNSTKNPVSYENHIGKLPAIQEFLRLKAAKSSAGDSNTPCSGEAPHLDLAPLACHSAEDLHQDDVGFASTPVARTDFHQEQAGMPPRKTLKPREVTPSRVGSALGAEPDFDMEENLPLTEIEVIMCDSDEEDAAVTPDAKGVSKGARRKMGMEAYDDDERPRKRSRVAVQLTLEQEEELVDWFLAHPIYYDQKEPDFKNRVMRARLLEIKAKEMGLTGILLWTWFKSMRTVYGKLKKRNPSLAAKPLTPRQQWTTNSFQFLESHLSVRGKSSQLGLLSESAETCEEEEETQHEEGSESEVSVASSSHQEPRSRQRRAKAKGKFALPLADPVPNGAAAQEDPQSGARTPDERRAFYQWMGLETNRLNEQLWTSFMSDAFALVMRYRQVQLQQNPAPQTHPISM